MFSARVFDRAGRVVLAPADVRLTPLTWAAAAVGGPTDAEIEAVGAVDSLLTLGTWLGYQVQVLTDDGAVVWWGQVDSVAVAAGGLTRETTLDGMANRVKVLYSQAQVGGGLVGAETDWAEDAASVAAYGRRELVHSASASLTETQALALRTRLLAAGATPQRRLTVDAGRGQAVGRVRCRGDWLRLQDVYYAQVAGIEAYADNAGEPIPLGLGVQSAYLAFTSRVHEIYGKLAQWLYAGLKVVISGTTSNNGVKTLASADRKEATTYTATTISFDPADDIFGIGSERGALDVGDVIWISGATTGSNNGAKLVKTAAAVSIEISPGWSGGDIVIGAAGPSITVRRGNSITVEETVIDERPNGSTVKTVTAYGQKVYQTLALGVNTAWTLDTVEIRARKVGSPGDSLRVALYTDASGTPGTLVEAVTLAGSALAAVMDWVALSFANTATLSYGTTYGLLIERTGAMDPEHFYEVAIDPEGDYGRGALRLHDGTNYQAATGTLIFRCLGAQDTALQVRDVVSGAGVEVAGVLVEALSGIDTVQYQAGDETALAIVEGLLAQGTAAGLRLLATMTSARTVRVLARQAANGRLLVWRDGELQLAQGGPAIDGWLPAGTWVHLDDVLLTGAWAGLSPVFVERAEYRVGQGLRLETEDQRALADLLGVRQG